MTVRDFVREVSAVTAGLADGTRVVVRTPDGDFVPYVLVYGWDEDGREAVILEVLEGDAGA